MQDGEAADAGIEHGDGQLGTVSHPSMVPKAAAPPPAADTVAPAMRALVVTNMYPSPRRPALGRFVADQVAALRRTGQAEVEVFAFDPGGARAYAAGGARAPRARYGPDPFDIVHAHYGLTTWPARAVPARRRLVTLHGTDLAHPRTRPITLAGLRAHRPRRRRLRAARAQHPALGGARPPPRRPPVRRRPASASARSTAPAPAGPSGFGATGPYLLFPADPARPEKRHDRARAAAGDVPLLTLGDVDPAQVPLWVNAANAVLVPSEREGFGLAVLEALACDVPVLATPAGIAPAALAGVPGSLCAPFDEAVWRAALAPHVAADDPRVEGRARAQEYSSDRMAERVLETWRGLLRA